ncbi:MAG: hypothetical protein E6G06_21760 [Actinobacteria bacterium]|nr:MAG: hypothetical protein E6G06_21760 [Actinomycetota bacterium]
MLTQIYGLTAVGDTVEVDRLQPDHIGVVLDEGIETWDSVDDATAIEIARAIENARLVALSLSTDSRSGPDDGRAAQPRRSCISPVLTR